ncbi:hypothetical protein Pmani_029765 [Petrolisthes manimaculis]|uniref:Myosin heavy chain n=1 Tax=Petrolisthes manimaculis TaxID=1843537 RepID=A0AAE1NZB6_9EUCA|nr:hypothetical protein Pmani_029765 [Petrolisthes manimaculis]
MPGHIKKSTGPDPDPTEFLFVSHEQKMKDQAKPYDPKTTCWVPNDKEGFVEGEIQGSKGELITVCAAGETKDWKKDLVNQVNPPKFEKCEDMSNLTYLNDPSVLYNLKIRYVNKLIYTYSGLFCIAVNPYKRYPIYTNRVVKIYQGKRRNEVPPHIFAISDGAYMDMLQGGTTVMYVSLSLSGESGAGKTENTKKVLSYFANVGATTKKKKEGVKEKPNLEDQIIQTNPVLEAFGNAKTVRNDNSSRFGKFIRIHFQPNGKLSGADIEVYLLEKARVISQQSLERSYHIFYEMMSDQIKDLKPMCFLSNDIYDYHYVSQGKVTVPSIDDGEDMQFCHDAFDVLGFNKLEVENVYRVTSTVMHLGEMKFKQRGREEQAEPDGTEVGETIGKLLGVDATDMYRNITKPKIKVGAEFVAKGMNVDQCYYGVGAMAKALFDRVFRWLVTKCNVTLETGLKRASFIGVLDIAGFEIFDYNGFEQICINFCNEKLQQFFNHHMFVLEQEEYKREGINWTFVDFGMDLQACIELFEKKMGVLSILEEESMFPKATDKSFSEKLNANHLGKSPVFIKPKPPKPGQPEAHFAIVHYAGTVSYNLSGWLEKNKDPLNDTLVDQFKKGSNELIVTVFADHPGQSGGGGGGEAKGGRGKKSGGFQTVSSAYRDQLQNLMRTLNATHPHFIRCIVPNETKSPGVVDAGLIMHQLTCNGVLEGIRICRKGFPNRMLYPDFKNRYKILASQEMSVIPDDKKAAQVCFDKAGLDKELYRLGKTKVFFRAGALGILEEVRDDRLSRMVAWLQAWVRGYIGRQSYKKLQEQRVALEVVQRNLRKFLQMRTWPWYNLWQKVKPLLNVTRIEDEMKALEDQVTKALEDLENETKMRQDLETANFALMEEKNTLLLALESTKGNASEFLEKEAKLRQQRAELETQLEDTTDRLHKEEEARQALVQSKKKVEQDVTVLKKEIQDKENSIHKSEQEKAAKEHVIHNLTDEINTQEELINKVKKEKKHLQDINQKSAEDNQSVEDKCNHLTTVKGKLEQRLDELEDALEHEKKLRSDSEKYKRKTENDLKLTQETVSELTRSRKELEAAIDRKDKEIGALAKKVEDEQHLVIKLNKSIKELQCRNEELEAEIQHERQVRSTAEKAKITMSRELSEVSDRLEEAGDATAAQIELNKKREGELARLRCDIEETNIRHASIMNNMRKKHNDSIGEMSGQIENLNKAKARSEKEKELLKRDFDEASNHIDRITLEKAESEKTNKQLQHQMHEVQVRLDEALRNLSDFDGTKKKLAAENADLLRQLEEAEAQLGSLNKLKISISNQLEEAKKTAEEEAKLRATLLGKYRNLEHDVDSLTEQLEDENEAKNELERFLSKASAETLMWRSKYENEGVTRAEELEAARLKLSCRLDEAEAQMEQLHVKNLNLEKTKQRAVAELEEMQVQVERAQTMAASAEKKQRIFDKVLGEWKLKVEDITVDFNTSQKECKTMATENFRISAAYEENLKHMDSMRRENKGLAEEIRALMDQLVANGRILDDTQKTVKRFELEKDELRVALEEVETALEQEENKVLRSQLEVEHVRQEVEKQLHEKEEEFECHRKNNVRAMESLQSTLEAEAKTKAEAVRVQKKMETDIHELEAALEHSNKANAEMQKFVKKLQAEVKEQKSVIENDRRVATEQRENLTNAERKINTLQLELEESRNLLEQSDRTRRRAEDDVVDINEMVRKLSSDNENLNLFKRKLESDLQTLHGDFDELSNDYRISEDKAKKAVVDAAHLTDQLRAEQEHVETLEKMRKGLEVTVKELQIRLEEIEGNAHKTGKAAFMKMESRVRELESQLHNESSLHSEAEKNFKKSERRILELSLQSDEDRKNFEKMQDLLDKLQQKVKSYKRQVDEAEEIAALNLAKYRKAQQELEEFEKRGAVTRTLVHRMERSSVSQSVM